MGWRRLHRSIRHAPRLHTASTALRGAGWIADRRGTGARTPRIQRAKIAELKKNSPMAPRELCSAYSNIDLAERIQSIGI